MNALTARVDSDPKAWIDEETRCICYRHDIDPAEIAEVTEMVRRAFTTGLLLGYRQGKSQR